MVNELAIGVGGFWLGGKRPGWKIVWVDFIWVENGGWISAGGKRLGGFWMGGFRLPTKQLSPKSEYYNIKVKDNWTRPVH